MNLIVLKTSRLQLERSGKFWQEKLVLTVFFLAAMRVVADVIPPERMVPWIPGVTVGIPGGIPLRTNIVDVTKTPYFADKTGRTNCSAAINRAITDAGFYLWASNTVIYLPSGNYKVTTPIYIAKSDLTLRGDGLGKTLVNGVGNTVVMEVGAGQVGNAYTIVGGASLGSTNLVIIPAANDAYGQVLNVGDTFTIDETLPITGAIHSINPGSGTGGVSLLNAVAAISGSGSNISLALPLPLDLTNSPVLNQLTRNNQAGNQCVANVGLEGISFTMTNAPSSEYGTGPEILHVHGARNFWMTNCELSYANQHFALLENVLFPQIEACLFDTAQSFGSGHGGLVYSMSGGLVENNIFANMLTSGIELDGGWGNAFFANYFTNSGWWVDMHGTHPLMDLFEANVSDSNFETDDYFGSCSHFTLFRNNIGYGVRFNRWSRQMNVVGNVLGESGPSWNYSADEHSQAIPAIYTLGLPNIGNQFYGGIITNDSAWNFPGTYYFDYTRTSQTIPYTPYTFTNTQGPTNVFWGNFAATGIRPYSTVLRLIFQDSLNTNLYHTIPTGNNIYPVSITSSNMTINDTFTVSNGWTMYVAGAVGYQQIQATDRKTHLITGNFDYYHNLVQWDANGPQALKKSFLYYNEAPGWWDTNHYRWPAIDPTNTTQMAAPIPAQLRYQGAQVSNTNQTGLTTPAILSLAAVSTNQINLNWSPATGAAGITYRVERTSDLTPGVFNLVGTPAGVSFTDNALAAATFYQYRIAAVDAAGDTSNYSMVVGIRTKVAGLRRIPGF